VIAIGSGTCTTAEYVWGQVMYLFTVFVTDYRTTSGTGIGSENHTILKLSSWLTNHFLNQITEFFVKKSCKDGLP